MADRIETDLQRRLLDQARQNYAAAFPQYSRQREAVLDALRKLVGRSDLHYLWKPKRTFQPPLHWRHAARIKNREFDVAQLEEYGIYTGTTAVDRRDEALRLHTGLYVLPAPLAEAHARTYRPEDYQRIRPYVVRSSVCRLPSRDPGFYLEIGAYGVYGEMVVHPEYRPPNGDGMAMAHFHLAGRCQNGEETFQTRSIGALDGIKLYAGAGEQTLVLSATVTVLRGLKGKLLRMLSSENENRQAYGLANLSEIWSAIYYRSVDGRSQRQNPTEGK